MSLKILFELGDSHLGHFLIKSHSGSQASLYEFKFYSALYVGDIDQMQDILTQIKVAQRNWNMQQFEVVYNDYDNWLNYLHEKINNRGEFLKKIQLNLRDKKIDKLQRSELIA